MGFKLPTITAEVDCAPIGYPGLLVEVVLNPTYTEHVFPWETAANPAQERERILREEPWQAELYYAWGRTIRRITFPPAMADSGRAETVDLGSAQAVYRLMTTDGFEQHIIVWAEQQRQKLRRERLEAEIKN